MASFVKKTAGKVATYTGVGATTGVSYIVSNQNPAVLDVRIVIPVALSGTTPAYDFASMCRMLDAYT